LVNLLLETPKQVVILFIMSMLLITTTLSGFGRFFLFEEFWLGM